MHHTLAVAPGGRLLGILQQRFFARVKKQAGETRKQRAAYMARKRDIWQESVACDQRSTREGTRFIHVADRGADNLRFMHALPSPKDGLCGCGAHHDRRVDELAGKLWQTLEEEPVPKKIQATIKANEATSRVPGVKRRRRQVVQAGFSSHAVESS